MSTAKEILMELLKKDGQPERLLKQYEPFEQIMTDPINQYCRGNRKRGVTSYQKAYAGRLSVSPENVSA